MIPKEEDELEVYCSTQHPSEIQKHIASMLNACANKIAVRVKRLGGGFGGKESRSTLLALPVAFAAHRYRHVPSNEINNLYFLKYNKSVSLNT